MTSADPAGAAVRAEGLSKLYGDHPAVVDLELAVPAGQTFGFLGPNGAGKSTTIAMLCTLLRPTAGRAVVAGHDAAREPEQVRRRIGLVFQEPTLDVDLTAAQNLRMHAQLFGLPRRQARDAVAAMLDLVDLAARKDSPVATFSGGMRRRLEIARGLLHTPRVLFLDEPTSGLDPQTRAAIWEHLDRMRREQETTVFLTTHQLEEAERCDRIAIIDDGEKVAEGTPADLKAIVGADLVVLRTADDEAAARALRAEYAIEATTGPGGVRLRVPDGPAFVPRLCASLAVPVHAVTVTPPSLDDVFLYYTGRSIREAGAPPMPMPMAAIGPRR
jgi:ABC-2 type transport system ATP-binding protein